ERLRFRSWQIGDQMKVDEQAGHFTVFVILAVDNSIRTSDNQVFRMQDKAALQTWLSDVIDPKKEEQAGAEGSFGLTDKELVQVFDDLSGKTRAKTQGQTLRSVLQAIQQDLRLTVEMSPFADQFVNAADNLEMELQDVAHGTALAAVCNTVSLAVVPHKSKAGQLVLRIVPMRQAEESWPIGWPREEKAVQLVPKLGEPLRVEIADTPLSTVLSALQPKLGVPMILDSHNLQLAKIDMSAKIKVPAKRSSYQQVLDRVLAQGLLKGDVRLDEAGQPFMLIEPIRSPR
ncbi:MAG: hypothetical protein KDA87_25440, partial [Planctomycetales bacterium]|nr:hypothetical protein [Planctomycetales bacterium]